MWDGTWFYLPVVDWIEADLNVSLQLNVRKWQSFSGWNDWNERSLSFGRDGLSFDILFTRGQTYLTKHYFHVLVVFKEPIDLVHKLDRLINSQTSDSLKKKSEFNSSLQGQTAFPVLRTQDAVLNCRSLWYMVQTDIFEQFPGQGVKVAWPCNTIMDFLAQSDDWLRQTDLLFNASVHVFSVCSKFI